MRVSISFGGFDPLPPTLESADAAEAAGLDGVWMAEHLGYTDGVVPTAAVLARTSRIEVGIVGAAPISRHPGLMAMELASLAEIAPGRVRAQVGLGDAGLISRLGGDHKRGLSVAREYVQVLKDLLTGAVINGEHAGYRFADFSIAPPAIPPPIDLMAIRPRMLEMATQVADGVSLSAGATRGYLTSAIGSVGTAIADAGRDRSAFRISAMVLAAVAEDRASAAEMLRPLLSLYAPDYFEVIAPGVFDPELLANTTSTDSLLTVDSLAEMGLVATPQTFVAELNDFLSLGLDEVCLLFLNPPDEIPPLLAEIQRNRA